MGFFDHVDSSGMALAAYLRIGGLPYLFATRSNAATVAVGDDLYTVQNTLLLEQIEGLDASVEPWAGLPSPSQLDVSVHSDAVLRGLVARSLYRGAVCVMTADAPPSATTITVNHTTGFDKEGLLYVGTETIRYAAKTATEFTGCTRGCFGSDAQYHVATWDGVNVRSNAGPYVSDHPLAMNGRSMELWLSAGQCFGEEGEEWFPFGSMLSSDDWLAWRGFLASLKRTSEGTYTFSGSDLLSVFDHEICTRLPRGKAEQRPGYINIDDWSADATVFVSPASGGTLASGRITHTLTDGVRSDWDVQSDLANLADLVQGQMRLDRLGGDGKFRLTVTATSADVGATITLVQPSGKPWEASLWAELGFERQQSAAVENQGSSVYSAIFVASDPQKAVRLPEGALRRVLYTPDDATFPYTPAASQSFVDDDGEWGGSFARIGDEVVRASGGWVTLNTATGARAYYLRIRERGCFGTENIARSEDDPTAVTWGLGLRSMPWKRALKYMLLCGADDGTEFGGAGWRGLGLGLPASILGDGWEGGTRVSIWVDEATTLRDVIEKALLAPFQAYCVAEDGALQLRDYPRILASDTADWQITQDDIDTEAGIDWDVPEDLIAHTVKAVGVGADIAAKPEGSSVVIIHGQSLATWGLTEPLEVDMRFATSAAQARGLAEALFDSLGSWLRPFAVIKLPIGSRKLWQVKVGDLVELTHISLPQLDGTGIGVTQLRGWVYGTSVTLRGATRGTLTVLVPSADGAKFGGWAPSLYGTNVASNRIYLDPGRYGPNVIRAGMTVRIYKPGDEASAVSKVVTVSTENDLYCSTNIGLTAPVIVELDIWRTVGASEQQFVYLGQGAPCLIDSDGEGFVYG